MAAYIPPAVTFKQHCPEQSIPMPDPNLLRVHYIVTQILLESGLGDSIDSALDDSRSLLCDNIAPDGSTDLGYILRSVMLTDI